MDIFMLIVFFIFIIIIFVIIVNCIDQGDLEGVRAAIESGTDVNSKDNSGWKIEQKRKKQQQTIES